MADIQKLTYPYFTDGTTQLNAANLNPIISKLNEVIDKVNGGVTPTQTVATPTISINGATATISCSTSGATIRYAIDGTPTESSGTTIASGGTIDLSSYNTQKTIRAIAYKSGMTTSQVAETTYNPAAPSVPTVTAAGKTITISADSGATIKYTLDGTTPSSSNGQTYSEPFELTASSGSGTDQAKYECTLKVVAIKDGVSSQVLTHVETAMTVADAVTLHGIKATDSYTAGSPVFQESPSYNVLFFTLNQSKKYNICCAASQPVSTGYWAYTNQKTSDAADLANITGSYVCPERSTTTDFFKATVLPNNFPYICVSAKYVSGKTYTDARYIFINEITETIS